MNTADAEIPQLPHGVKFCVPGLTIELYGSENFVVSAYSDAKRLLESHVGKATPIIHGAPPPNRNWTTHKGSGANRLVSITDPAGRLLAPMSVPDASTILGIQESSIRILCTPGVQSRNGGRTGAGHRVSWYEGNGHGAKKMEVSADDKTFRGEDGPGAVYVAAESVGDPGVG